MDGASQCAEKLVRKVNAVSPGKGDGALSQRVDGDVVGREVPQVIEELVLHRRRQRGPQVRDV